MQPHALYTGKRTLPFNQYLKHDLGKVLGLNDQ